MKYIGLIAFITLFTSGAGAQQSNKSKIDNAPVPDCGLPMPALVTLHPLSQVICPGHNVMFISAAVIDQGFFWEMSTDNGVTWTNNIPNASASLYDMYKIDDDTLTIFAVSPQMNGYKFRCSYNSPCGPDSKTAIATLTVGSYSTSIISQPGDISACVNTAVDFIISVTGSSISYQWEQSNDGGNNFASIPGKTSAVLHFDSVGLNMNNTRYRCVVGSECNPVAVTVPALLNVRNESTAIVTQPLNQKICDRTNAVFTVAATGNNLSYQWQKYYYQPPGYVNITGETASSITLPYPESGFYYRCQISSTCKTLYTDQVSVTYKQTPVFAAAEEKYACTNERVTFSAIPYYSGEEYNFQWEASADSGITYTVIPGETSNYLSLTVSPAISGYRYRCHTGDNCFDSFSSVHKLYNIYVPTVITSQPQDKNACVGFSYILSIRVTGRIASIQWQKSTDSGNHFSDLINGDGGYDYTTNNMTLYNVSLAQNNYLYRCKIASYCGDTLYSDTVVLKVFTNPALGYDKALDVPCDTCNTDITHVFDTSDYAAVVWSTSTPAAVSAGKYKLKVYNPGGCNDSAFISVNVNKRDTIEFCKNGAANFTSSVSGTSYFWQVDWGFGYNGLHDTQGSYDNVISGSASATLTITNLNFNGKVRCLVDNSSFSNEIVFKMVNRWNGAVSSEWENPLNWSCGEVPDSNTEVVIPANAQRVSEISTSVSCKKLFLQQDAEVIIKPGKNLNVGVSN